MTTEKLEAFRGENKAQLCSQLEALLKEVNELALRLSVYDSKELNYIWLNLANARANLVTALDSTRELKENRLPIPFADWTI